VLVKKEKKKKKKKKIMPFLAIEKRGVTNV
jgi:hypothetical protein